MKKRLFLLPGFGEDTFCFNEIIPFIKGYEFVHVDYRLILQKFTFPFISAKQFSRQLIKHYNIRKEDKLIGHSMGGYFSFQIRELIGTEICMIGAFNDTKKVIHIFPKLPRVTQAASLLGITKTSLLKNYMLKQVKDNNYKEVMRFIMNNFDSFTNTELALMTEMLYGKPIKSELPNPLRIHDKADRVIAPPDEPYFQVKGGHFCLNLYPEETIGFMKDFLKK